MGKGIDEYALEGNLKQMINLYNKGYKCTYKAMDNASLLRDTTIQTKIIKWLIKNKDVFFHVDGIITPNIYLQLEGIHPLKTIPYCTYHCGDNLLANDNLEAFSLYKSHFPDYPFGGTSDNIILDIINNPNIAHKARIINDILNKDHTFDKESVHKTITDNKYFCLKILLKHKSKCTTEFLDLKVLKDQSVHKDEYKNIWRYLLEYYFNTEDIKILKMISKLPTLGEIIMDDITCRIEELIEWKEAKTQIGPLDDSSSYSSYEKVEIEDNIKYSSPCQSQSESDLEEEPEDEDEPQSESEDGSEDEPESEDDPKSEDKEEPQSESEDGSEDESEDEEDAQSESEMILESETEDEEYFDEEHDIEEQLIKSIKK